MHIPCKLLINLKLEYVQLQCVMLRFGVAKCHTPGRAYSHSAWVGDTLILGAKL